MKKLFKTVLSLVLCAFVLTGCQGLIDKYVPTPDPVRPTVNLDCNENYKIHYDETTTLKVIAEVDDNGSLSYQWFKCDKDEFNKASAISGATSKEYVVSGDSEQNWYYWCQVTNKLNLKTIAEESRSVHVIISNIENITESINDSTTWYSKYTYWVQTDCYVHEKLTIQPGTVVKFEKDGWLGAENGGVINANATEEKPIIFTSETDNSVGISVYKGTNEPKAGFWEGISLRGGSGSILQNCSIQYAGSEGLPAVEVLAKSTVYKCTIANNKTPSGTKIGALSIRDEEGIKSTVEYNAFYNNDWPLSCDAGFTVSTTNQFLPDGKKNKHNAIFIFDSAIESNKVVSFQVTEIPFLCDDIDLRGKLTIEDNVIVRFLKDTSLDVYNYDNNKAELIVKNCLLSSYLDDENGGDIMDDGEDTAEENDWQGVWIEDSGRFNNDINKNSAKVLYNNDSLENE